jgi:membrane carboxypeptidase/penicillin-binding protein PbpC
MAEHIDDQQSSPRHERPAPTAAPHNNRREMPRPRGRHHNTTITEMAVARIETVAMTRAEEDEAVAALAVLIARFWRGHPDQAA